MRGLKPGWEISVLGETPTLFAGGLESPEREAGNRQMRAESRPFCKLVTSTWLGFCGSGLFSSHSPEQSTGQAQSRSTRLNQDQQARTILPKLNPVGLPLWEVSHWVTQGVPPAFHENTRGCPQLCHRPQS